VLDEAHDLIMFAEANLANVSVDENRRNTAEYISIHRFESDSERGGGKKSAFQYQEIMAREEFKSAGFNYLDSALALMDQNLASFSAFAGSSEFAQYRGSIIYTVSQMESAYSIGGSYLVFSRLKPLFGATEDFEIAPAVGETLMDKLRAEVLKTDTFDTKLQALLPKVRKAIAHFAIAELLRQPGDITDRGLVFEGIDAVNSNFQTRTQVSDAQVQQRINQAQQYALNYLGALKDFLTTNITDYPDYSTHIGTDDNALDIDSSTEKNCTANGPVKPYYCSHNHQRISTVLTTFFIFSDQRFVKSVDKLAEKLIAFH
jgi:hypothetical protein